MTQTSRVDNGKTAKTKKVHGYGHKPCQQQSPGASPTANGGVGSVLRTGCPRTTGKTNGRPTCLSSQRRPTPDFKPALAGWGFRARAVGFGVLLCWHTPRCRSADCRRSPARRFTEQHVLKKLTAQGSRPSSNSGLLSGLESIWVPIPILSISRQDISRASATNAMPQPFVC